MHGLATADYVAAQMSKTHGLKAFGQGPSRSVPLRRLDPAGELHATLQRRYPDVDGGVRRPVRAAGDAKLRSTPFLNWVTFFRHRGERYELQAPPEGEGRLAHRREKRVLRGVLELFGVSSTRNGATIFTIFSPSSPVFVR